MKSPKYYDSLVFSFLSLLIYELASFMPKLQKKSLLLSFITKPFSKTFVISIFVISLVIFPGYDATNTIFLKSSLEETAVNKEATAVGVILFLATLLPLLGMLLYQYQKRPKVIFLRLDLLLLAFIIIAEFATIFSYDVKISFYSLIKLLRGLLIYFVFSRLILERKHYLSIVITFILTLFIEGTLAILQYANGGLLGVPFESFDKVSLIGKITLDIEGASYFRSVGTFSHPNTLSFFIALLIPFTMVYVFSKNYFLRIWSYITSVLIVGALISSFSRLGIVIFIFALMLTIILIKKYLKLNLKNLIFKVKLQALLLILMSILIFVSPIFVERFLEFTDQSKTLFEPRMALVSESLFIIRSNPFLGIGGGNFSNYLINYDVTEMLISLKFPSQVHNLYLLLASESGMFALIVFLGLCIEVMRIFFQGISMLSVKDRLVAICLFASLMTFLFYGLLEYRVLSDHLALIFWMELGLLVNLMAFNRSR